MTKDRKATEGGLGRALDALARLPSPGPYVGTILPGDAPSAATPEQRWDALLRSIGCIVCRRFVPSGRRVELHHVAEGSGLRSPFGKCPLCVEHHRGATGLHVLSPPVFAARYELPGESEFGLLVWVAEDIARFRLR